MLYREKLENHQALLYIVVLAAAFGFGFMAPGLADKIGASISIITAILMYSMFSQIPFASLKQAFADRRYLAALLLTNYMAVPAVVWILSGFLPDNTPLLLGFFLVLLTPCIDYVIVFTALGKGDEKLVLMSTPVLFITQLLLLPVYLWLFMGPSAAGIVQSGPFLQAFFGLIVVPLCIAIAVQLLARNSSAGDRLIDFSAWLPVPFMALTLFAVVASQIGKVSAFAAQLVTVIPLYIAFMIVMPVISRFIAKRMHLDAGAGRALAFSGATRNSLVVLPLALSLPGDVSTLAAAVIVTQTIVELAGELVYIRWVPKLVK